MSLAFTPSLRALLETLKLRGWGAPLVAGLCIATPLVLRRLWQRVPFTPTYQSPFYPLALKILAPICGGFLRKALLLNPPKSSKAPDITELLPPRREQPCDGVTLVISSLLNDPEISGMVFGPTTAALKPIAVDRALAIGGPAAADAAASDIERAIALCTAHAAGKLSKEELVKEGMVTVNFMAVLRLKSGGLLIYNPVRMSRAVQDWLKELGGDVKYLVSPLAAHKTFMQEAKQAYPSAKVVACQSAAEAFVKLPMVIDFVYSDPVGMAQLQAVLEPEGIQCMFVDGDPHETIVMLHMASATLLQADIVYSNCFNRHPKSSGVPEDTPFCRAMRNACTCSPNGRVCLYRLDAFNPDSPIYHLQRVKPDRKLFKASLERILSLKFDGVVDCHAGYMDAAQYAELLQKEFDWL